MSNKRRRATVNLVRQRELTVDRFVRDGATSGCRECFERGLSMSVPVGKELGAGDV